MEAQAQSGGKILVAYFSWSGNAKTLAEQIARETGGTVFEIKTANAYPGTYNKCIAAAKEELNRNDRPALQGNVTDMGQYGTVFLCYPNWWGTLPMGVFTFLEAYDFSGKTIYPLVTHGGGRFGRSLDDLQRLCPQAVIGEGRDSTGETSPNRDVTSWLHRLGMTK